MSEANGRRSGGGGPTGVDALVGRLRSVGLTADVGLALGVVAILVVLILPMPTWLLDISLAISITFSVVVLMTCLFIQKPLEFSSFPTVLLIATMLRLSLNLASTRLILGEGDKGTDAAGQVIQAFGDFVMGGNFVIGLIVFGILVIVNFVVITKGSGRIAEVAARFTLDSMPGKQMAIDADLSSGLIDEGEARKRRKTLEDESNFFGAMDGAAKFVRGDAIAGLLITFINIIGGMIIGVAQKDMSFSDALNNYTVLTVGDGLVSQIPALIVSTAAGLMVSKGGVEGSTEKALFAQLGGYPKALAVTSFLMLALAVLPGIPAIPFLLLGGITGGLAWYLIKSRRGIRRGRGDRTAGTGGGACGGADLQRLADRRPAAGTGLWPAAADQRGAGRAADRPDQGAAAAAGHRHGLHHAQRTHSGQYAAGLERLHHPGEGGGGRARRAEGQPSAGHGPNGAKIDLPGEETVEPTFACRRCGRTRACARKRCSAAIPSSIPAPSSPPT